MQTRPIDTPNKLRTRQHTIARGFWMIVILKPRALYFFFTTLSFESVFLSLAEPFGIIVEYTMIILTI